MRGRVSRWGNSLAIRIPSSVRSEIQLDEGSAVDLTVEDGRLLVTPVVAAYRLEDLVAGIDDTNCHAETGWGDPIGNEVWCSSSSQMTVPSDDRARSNSGQVATKLGASQGRSFVAGVAGAGK